MHSKRAVADQDARREPGTALAVDAHPARGCAVPDRGLNPACLGVINLERRQALPRAVLGDIERWMAVRARESDGGCDLVRSRCCWVILVSLCPCPGAEDQE
jgi:hypothetical protein